MSRIKIAVIDYGMGNLRSVTKALQHVAINKAEVLLTEKPEEVFSADKVVFPGQGAMRDCMRELNASGLRDAILDAARHKPFLGICVGAQLLLEHSEEGDTPALSFYSGEVKRFPAAQQAAVGERFKVPHMGWNQVKHLCKHPLFHGIADGARFYFVHSYYMLPSEVDLTLAITDYPFAFASVIGRGNIFATQFHPEKSADAGLKMLENFVNWNGKA